MVKITHSASMKDRKRATVRLIVLAVGLVSGCAGWIAANVFHSLQDESQEVATTIENVRWSPNAFSGKKVRLTGRLSECYHWECSLCPETLVDKDLSADRCLALSFRPLVNGTGFGSDEQENVFRFSSVVLTATFDPSCWKGACTDRQTVLNDAQVVSVVKRRAGASGLWVGKTLRLVPINGPDAQEISAAARRAGYPANLPIRAFTTVGDEPKLVVCSSLPGLDDDPGGWPATFESALYAKSTLDFFQCNEVRQIDGQAVLQAHA